MVDNELHLYITTEILEEYEEILQKFYSSGFAERLIEFLLELPETSLISPYYSWNLITEDADDNKFVDCAIAANARFLVSQDRHFQVLSSIDFPQVNLINIDDFMKKLS